MDAFGRLRTHTVALVVWALFASVGRCLHSGKRARAPAAEGAGLNARGHRQYQDHNSGAESGTRAD